jgi:hypothetical protein
MSFSESGAGAAASDIVIAARGLTRRHGALGVVNFDIVEGEGVRRGRPLVFILRFGAGNSPCKVIPRDLVQRVGDQFIGLGRPTAVAGLQPLGFPDIVERKLAEAVKFRIVRERIDRRQQVSGACARAIASRADHGHLLKSFAFPRVREGT